MSLLNTLFTSFSIKSGTIFNNILIRAFSALVFLKILLISQISKSKIKESIGNPSIFLFFLILLLIIILGSIFPFYF
jgi:hypothetical protein